MNRTSISDLKAKAKDQLLGNYGVATGSFALIFVLIYAIISILSSALTYSVMKNISVSSGPQITTEIAMQAFSIVIAIITALFTVGYLHVMKTISDNERAGIHDLFFVFKNHPDKVIILSFVMTIIQVILLLPATVVGFSGAGQAMYFNGKQFLLYIVLYLAGLIISLVIDIMFAMCYMIYLDDPETDVLAIMKGSLEMMKGNKFRYFYMILSFLGYWLLVILSLGIAALWVVPYQMMTTVEFYKDLTGDCDRVSVSSDWSTL